MRQLRYILSAMALLLGALALSAMLRPLIASSGEVIPEETLSYCGTSSTSSISPRLSPVGQAGKTLFQQNCQSCHSLHKHLTGPALAGFESRGPWKDRKELYRWIHNPAAFMKRNAYVRALQQSYGSLMPSFPGLTKGQIDTLAIYLTEGAN